MRRTNFRQKKSNFEPEGVIAKDKIDGFGSRDGRRTFYILYETIWLSRHPYVYLWCYLEITRLYPRDVIVDIRGDSTNMPDTLLPRD